MQRIAALWWLPAIALAAIVAFVDRRVESGDLVFFEDAARTLLSPDWETTYGDRDLQTGPLQLFLIGGIARLAGTLGMHPQTLLSIVVQVGLTAMFLAAAGRALRGRQGREIALGLAGVAFVLLGLPHGAFVDGHVAQVAIPILWVLAALDARENRVAMAGALVGLAAGFETWGILGLPVLLLAQPAWRAVNGAATAVLAGLALYAPFLVAGDFRMLDLEWAVSSGSLIGQVVEPGTAFTWQHRVAQGAVVLLAASVVAWFARHSMHAIWLVPMVVVVVRLLLDPVLYSWYLIGFETVLLFGVAELATSDLARRLVSDRRQTVARLS